MHNYTTLPLEPAALYEDINYAALNSFEKLWADYYIWMGDPTIATGLMSFVLHEVITVLSTLPSALILLQRSSTSDVAYPGRSSTESHTSASGSSSQYVDLNWSFLLLTLCRANSQIQQRNGAASGPCFCPILRSSCLRSAALDRPLSCPLIRPQIWFFHPLAEACGLSTYHVPFPSWQTMVWQIALFFIFEDAYHYVGA